MGSRINDALTGRNPRRSAIPALANQLAERLARSSRRAAGRKPNKERLPTRTHEAPLRKIRAAGARAQPRNRPKTVRHRQDTGTLKGHFKKWRVPGSSESPKSLIDCEKRSADGPLAASTCAHVFHRSRDKSAPTVSICWIRSRLGVSRTVLSRNITAISRLRAGTVIRNGFSLLLPGWDVTACSGSIAR
jgi:hypothetical protein